MLVGTDTCQCMNNRYFLWFISGNGCYRLTSFEMVAFPSLTILKHLLQRCLPPYLSAFQYEECDLATAHYK